MPNTRNPHPPGGGERLIHDRPRKNLIMDREDPLGLFRRRPPTLDVKRGEAQEYESAQRPRGEVAARRDMMVPGCAGKRIASPSQQAIETPTSLAAAALADKLDACALRSFPA